jgi:hypothetical protein
MQLATRNAASPPHGPLEDQRYVRDRAQHRLHLQGQAGRREASRQRIDTLRRRAEPIAWSASGFI